MKKELELKEIKKPEPQFQQFGHANHESEAAEIATTEEAEIAEPEEKPQNEFIGTQLNNLSEKEADEIVAQIFSIIQSHYSSLGIPLILNQYQSSKKTVELMCDVLKIWDVFLD